MVGREIFPKKVEVEFNRIEEQNQVYPLTSGNLALTNRETSAVLPTPQSPTSTTVQVSPAFLLMLPIRRRTHCHSTHSIQFEVFLRLACGIWRTTVQLSLGGGVDSAAARVELR